MKCSYEKDEELTDRKNEQDINLLVQNLDVLYTLLFVDRFQNKFVDSNGQVLDNLTIKHQSLNSLLPAFSPSLLTLLSTYAHCLARATTRGMVAEVLEGKGGGRVDHFEIAFEEE